MDDAPFFEDAVQLDPDVDAAIMSVFPSDDPLDSSSFDPVAYINKIFPSKTKKS